MVEIHKAFGSIRNAAAASQLAVSGITDPVIAGVASNVTVRAEDAFGNTATGYTGTITAVARYPDEVEQLEKLGVKAALNLYTEAGTAYAEHVYEQFGVQLAR